MKRLQDLTGQSFGRWTVIGFHGRSTSGEVLYLCKCACGTERVLRRSSLMSGNSKSCGCLSRDASRARETKHGYSKTRLYHIWGGMIYRCCNPDYHEWEKYGGRGIAVCEQWKNFEAFRDWALLNGYDDNLTIDRIDNNGNYEPSNCRWATTYQQCNNKRTSKYLSFNGETMTIREFADKFGLVYSCLYARLKMGWTVRASLLTPSRGRKTA